MIIFTLTLDSIWDKLFLNVYRRFNLDCQGEWLIAVQVNRERKSGEFQVP